MVTEFGFSLRIFESSFSWNFQIPESRKSGNGHFWQIATYWEYFPLKFGHGAWFSSQNFWIIIFLEFPDSRFQEIWKWPFLTNCNILGISSTWFWSLCSIFHSEFVNFHFPGISRFQKIWKISGNCLFWEIATYWVYYPLSFGHWV